MSEIYIIKDTGKGVINGLLPEKVVPVKVNSLNLSYSITEIQTGGTWIDGKPIYKITKLTVDPIPNDIDTRFPDEVIGDYTVYKFTKTSE